MTTVVLLGLIAALGQAGPAGADPSPQMSDTVFKNVRVLKGIPIDEFMDTMGMFASSLGYDCSSCHSPEIRTNRDAFAIETPAIQRARGMITMMNTINRTYFRGEPRLSCQGDSQVMMGIGMVRRQLEGLAQSRFGGAETLLFIVGPPETKPGSRRTKPACD